jgi:hypothetical protein
MTHWGVPLNVLPSTELTGSTILGDVIDLGEVRDVHVMQANVSDLSGGSIFAAVYGSLDGENFYTNEDVVNIPGGEGSDAVFVGQGTLPARFVQGAIGVVSGSPTATIGIWLASGIS